MDIEDELEDELEIANTFNKFFIEKISNLKNNIDTSIKQDPLTPLKKTTRRSYTLN